MFCPGTAKRSNAARNSSKLRARLTASMAPISSLASWPAHFSASGGRSSRARGGASVTIGPQRVSRTLAWPSIHQRTRMRSRLSAISESGTPPASTRSLEAARKFVPPQAMCGLRPMAKTGSPGPISPTA